MTLLACGLNHKTAPLRIRERLALSPDQHHHYIQAAFQQHAIKEVAVLSTCNRTEIYCETDDPRAVLEWLGKKHVVEGVDLTDFIYVYRNQQAARHMMRVACGLDSMVLGEPQILGQIKRAYQQGAEMGSIGKHLGGLFRAVFSASKKVRSETAIGIQPVSIAYVGVNLVKQHHPNLATAKILLIGAGETMELTARYLHQQGAQHFWVANRTYENAGVLAEQFQGHSLTIGEIAQVLPHMDIVISATASPVPIIGKGAVETACAARWERRLLMLDLAVPRDFEPEIAALSYVSLYNIDDLQMMVRDNLNGRQDAARQAEQIIEMELDKYIRLQRTTRAVKAIRHYRGKMLSLAEKEADRALGALSKGTSPDEVIRELTRRVLNKTLHLPSLQLQKAARESRHDILKLAEYMFDSSEVD